MSYSDLEAIKMVSQYRYIWGDRGLAELVTLPVMIGIAVSRSIDIAIRISTSTIYSSTSTDSHPAGRDPDRTLALSAVR